MMRNQTVAVLGILLLLVVVGSIFIVNQSTHPPQSEHHESGIAVRSNLGFALYGWIGNGTSDNPYIIEGLTMVTSGPSITISNTDAYFIIRNCTLQSTTGGIPCAIVFDTVKNGVIENCTLTAIESWGAYGSDVVIGGVCVRILESVDCRIEHCRLFGSSTGLMISNANSCEIVNNKIYDNWYGVHVEDSSVCSLIGNVVDSLFDGITLSRTNMCEIDTNWISCEYTGLQLHYSENYRITNNRFLDCGIWLGWGYNPSISDYIFLNNLVNAKPYGYFHNFSDMTIDVHMYGQVVLSHCTNLTITGGDFRNSSVGIEIKSSQKCVITRSNFLGNNRMGVSIEDGRDILVTNCTFFENTWSIDVRRSSNITIDDNFLSHNIISIAIMGSEKCMIARNTIMNGSYAITISDSEYCEISNNYLEYNWCGISISYSTQCTIFENHVYYSEFTGVHLGLESDNCQVFMNSIGGNWRNAEDDGDMNQWDDGASVGNFWSDYGGTGWYYISGTASSYDRYPSALPGEWDTSVYQHNLAMFIVTVGLVTLGIFIVGYFILKRKRLG